MFVFPTDLGVVSTCGFVLQDKQHSKTYATRGKALVHAHRGHAVEAPEERYLACRYHCRLFASTELATREIRPAFLAKIWQTVGTPGINVEASQSCRRPAPRANSFLEGASALESNFAQIFSGFPSFYSLQN